MPSLETLCLACGLCCDGTLFGHVKLADGEAAKLKSLGMPVKTSRAQVPITFFRQPCSALCADRTCRIYADRPGQCAAFECGVLKQAKAGAIPLPKALRTVTRTRKQAESIREMLRALGDADEHRPLTDRFHRTQRGMESGNADPAAHQTYADLSQAFHVFRRQLEEKFYTK